MSFDKDLHLRNTNSNQGMKHYFPPESSLMSPPSQLHRQLLFWFLSTCYTLLNNDLYFMEQLIYLMTFQW